MRYDSILASIGNTPCVRVRKVAPEHVRVFVKLEGLNPCTSQEDRLALSMIERAEQSAALAPGQTIVEASGGRMGVALAMVCARKGYPLVMAMPVDLAPEKRLAMRTMGAKVVLTPAEEGSQGALHKAQALAEAHGWFWLNGACHNSSGERVAEQLGREILRDFSSLPLDYCVTAAPGEGLISGLRHLFAEQSPGTQVVACQIAQQALPLAPGKNISVSAADALQTMKALARQEGIITGLRGGAALAGALQIAEQAVPGSHIVCVLPDTGEQSLQEMSLKRDCASMSEEERAIAASTAGQWLPATLPLMRIEDEEPFIADLSQKLLGQFLAGEEFPVLLFAYEWCEMGRSVRTLFEELCIPFRCIDLDADVYQTGQVGARLKAALTVHTGLTTLPQVFIAGKCIGGCIELFDSVNNRSLFGMLDRAGVQYNHLVQLDPYALLPGWAQAPSAEVRLS